MFSIKSSSLLLLGCASQLQLALADLSLRIGYASSLAASFPGTEPTIGCELLVDMLEDGQGGGKITYLTDDGKAPQDGCPFWENELFCDRWGCPFEMIFSDVIDVVVESDNSDDGTITVSAVGLNGGTKTATCPQAVETVWDNDSGHGYYTWACDLTGL
ncbi:hypothetical protein BJY04DRAFT_177999 [Aspergillus karnatakaensis]|uniref:uncharacterized protein n=1 Tax=Aspergillus karnatakaensis TaxID=1810916 RepID=UPI003CCD74B0